MTKKIIFIWFFSCLLFCSCSLNNPTKDDGTQTAQINNETTNNEENAEKNDYYSPSLSEEEKDVLSGSVTLEILESVVGELVYDSQPIASSHTTYIYKGKDNKSYELEFDSLEPKGEILSCRIHEDDYKFMFCKKKSVLYWQINIKFNFKE
jgi:hypothetical protein